MKGQTLQEISEMVTKITEKLKVERERLQPMVRGLHKFIHTQLVHICTWSNCLVHLLLFIDSGAKIYTRTISGGGRHSPDRQEALR